MIKYPLVFHAQAKSASGINSRWETSAPSLEQNLLSAIPPEFQGPGGGYSPEDFYALALCNCFIATFKVFAEKSNLAFSSLNVGLELSVDRDDKGMPWMARAHLSANLVGVDSKEKAERLLEKTSKGCLVLNSVKTEKTFTFNVG